LRPRWWAVVAALSALTLAGCTTLSARRIAYDTEEFDSTTTHTRTFPATAAQTCEAARRALLSQGYLITAANADLVTGRKSFQPTPEVHVEVEFRVVCAHEGASDGTAKSASGARGKGVAPRSIDEADDADAGAGLTSCAAATQQGLARVLSRV